MQQWSRNQWEGVKEEGPPVQSGNQLTRRVPNPPVVPVHTYDNSQNGRWAAPGQVSQGGGENGWGQYDDLDERATVAKREAESNRKHIAPFILKLSRYVKDPEAPVIR